MFHPEGPTFRELARQAASSTERGYDLLAPKFDLTPFRTPDDFLTAAAPYLGPPGSLGSALDLCCGTGAVLEVLRPLCRDRVVGVDFSRGMLEVARRRLASWAGEVEVELVRTDVLDLAFDAEFDVATCFSAIGHIPRRKQPRLLRRVARALRPGGRFVTVSGYLPPPWYPPLWIALAFNAAMAVRNFLWRPPFVMYYLNFLLPNARRLLEANGYEVEIHRRFCSRFPRYHLVVGTVASSPSVTTRALADRDPGGSWGKTNRPTWAPAASKKTTMARPAVSPLGHHPSGRKLEGGPPRAGLHEERRSS